MNNHADSSHSVEGEGEGRIVEGETSSSPSKSHTVRWISVPPRGSCSGHKTRSSVPHRKVVSPHGFPLAMAGRGWPNQGKGERGGKVNGESHLGPTPHHSVPGGWKERQCWGSPGGKLACWGVHKLSELRDDNRTSRVASLQRECPDRTACSGNITLKEISAQSSERKKGMGKIGILPFLVHA